MTLIDDLGEVHVTGLEGLGASYRIRGFFTLKMTAANETTVNFDAVAFGGNYGGHNVNVKISDEIRNKILKDRGCSDEELEELISEVQRKMLNNDMIVEYDKLAPQNENSDGLGNIGV